MDQNWCKRRNIFRK